MATSILCSTRRPLIPITHQTLLHPILSTNISDRPTKSEFEFFDGPLLSVALGRRAVELYIPHEETRDTELASPLLITPQHAKVQPRTLIVNASVDLLRDDGILFGQILQQAGVDCAVFTAHGQIHDSEVIEATRAGETPRVIVRMVTREIRGAIGGEGGVNGKEGKNRADEGEEEDGTSEVGEEEKGKKEPARKKRRTRRS